MVATLSLPTVWGLTPVQLHDRFWASQGIQVVRQGEPSEIVEHAELFLLTDARSLVVFNVARLVDMLYWADPALTYVRLLDRRERGYREHVISGEDDEFVRFERSYGGAEAQLARVCLTRDAQIARAWQGLSNARTARNYLRRRILKADRNATSIPGSVYDRSSDRDLMTLTRQLVRVWKRPDTMIRRATRGDTGAWVDIESRPSQAMQCVGPVWVGAGRTTEDETIVGPGILWDDPAARPRVERIEWESIEPTQMFSAAVRPRRTSSVSAALKRAFDIAFAAVALLLTLPLYPFVILAIWIEDGRPFFFCHRRETRGGKEFPCIKFRSMRKDAEHMKQQLRESNQSDGPQFFMDRDPRLTRVGHLIRAANIDELPQFLNVLLGHMSIVGPRPSPRSENQCCPAWREARLSVRPGVTGLWQVKRTRQPGMDFQEWVRYDIEYVETANWRLDFAIICATIQHIIQGGKKS